jgi:hypothetical protein
MMPWEHVIVGYVAYSVIVHLVYRDSPTGSETLVVVFASILPDLIDKPLSWEFGLFGSGYALGHSVFFAIPLSAAVAALAIRRERPRLGMAFGIGYLLHLPADVIPGYLRGGELKIDRLLWPVRVREGSPGEGFRAEFLENVVPYLLGIFDPEPSSYVFVLVGMVFVAALLWIYDGMPVAREAYGFVHRWRSGRDRSADD